MSTNYEAVIGLEIHAELATESKMFCGCAVVDTTTAAANTAVCPVCAALPGSLPVVNQRAVEFGLRVALALDCEINQTSIFARKNYFYPDLPKGYQISQYEQPLAQHGKLTIPDSTGWKTFRIRRVHLEEDTGKLTHIQEIRDGETAYTLVNLNRAGVPLLEIVTEPDFRSAEQVRAFASALRTLLRYLEVNSGDMEKGVLRIEPNVSIRPSDSEIFGTRTEIKNLNSFRALERSVDYEIRRQIELISQGKAVIQQTLGWNDIQEITHPQRSKEEAHDYRYFPEPDLPPLTIEQDWIDRIRRELPELPANRYQRFQSEYDLSPYDAAILTDERGIADYFEETLQDAAGSPPKVVANWITGELFSWMNREGTDINHVKVSPNELAELIQFVAREEINLNTAKTVFAAMLEGEKTAGEIITSQKLSQISDPDLIKEMVRQVLRENTDQVEAYLQGKETLSKWFYGQVMRLSKGKANPRIVEENLNKQLAAIKQNEMH